MVALSRIAHQLPQPCKLVDGFQALGHHLPTHGVRMQFSTRRLVASNIESGAFLGAGSTDTACRAKEDKFEIFDDRSRNRASPSTPGRLLPVATECLVWIFRSRAQVYDVGQWLLNGETGLPYVLSQRCGGPPRDFGTCPPLHTDASALVLGCVGTVR